MPKKRGRASATVTKDWRAESISKWSLQPITDSGPPSAHQLSCGTPELWHRCFETRTEHDTKNKLDTEDLEDEEAELTHAIAEKVRVKQFERQQLLMNCQNTGLRASGS